MRQFELDLKRTVRVGSGYWSGRIKIVDASARNMPPDHYSKIEDIVFAGRNVFESLRAYRAA